MEKRSLQIPKTLFFAGIQFLSSYCLHLCTIQMLRFWTGLLLRSPQISSDTLGNPWQERFRIVSVVLTTLSNKTAGDSFNHINSLNTIISKHICATLLSHSYLIPLPNPLSGLENFCHSDRPHMQTIDEAYTVI